MFKLNSVELRVFVSAKNECWFVLSLVSFWIRSRYHVRPSMALTLERPILVLHVHLASFMVFNFLLLSSFLAVIDSNSFRLVHYCMKPAILFSRKLIHNFPYTFLVKIAYLTNRTVLNNMVWKSRTVLINTVRFVW